MFKKYTLSRKFKEIEMKLDSSVKELQDCLKVIDKYLDKNVEGWDKQND